MVFGNALEVLVQSKLDLSLAPPSHHEIHPCMAGNEKHQNWERFEYLVDNAVAWGKDRNDHTFKAEKAKPIWNALAKWALAVKLDAAEVELVRYLGHYGGNHGLAIAAGNKLPLMDCIDLATQQQIALEWANAIVGLVTAET